MLNIFTATIPNKFITVNDKDAPWMTPDVKAAIKRNDRIYRRWKRRGRLLEGKTIVTETQKTTHETIEHAKLNYSERLSKRLIDPASEQNFQATS